MYILFNCYYQNAGYYLDAQKEDVLLLRDSKVNQYKLLLITQQTFILLNYSGGRGV